MDEKERQDSLPADADTESLVSQPAEDSAIISAEDEVLDGEVLDGDEDDDEDEPKQRLYFGRFTPGVWHGGVLGIALSYILTGLFGLANARFNLGMRHVLESPYFKYGIIIALCFGLGKLGGYLEKRKQEG